LEGCYNKEVESSTGPRQKEDALRRIITARWNRIDAIRQVLISRGKPHDSITIQAISRQKDEALRVNKEKKIDSACTINSVIEKAESNATCAESTDSKEASFIEQEHGKLSERTVLNFSGCKGAYMLPYEFRAKEIDEHQEQENIAEQSSVDKEHQSEEARDPEKEEEKALENHTKVEQSIVQIMQPPCSSNVFKEVYPANNLLIF